MPFLLLCREIRCIFIEWVCFECTETEDYAAQKEKKNKRTEPEGERMERMRKRYRIRFCRCIVWSDAFDVP